MKWISMLRSSYVLLVCSFYSKKWESFNAHLNLTERRQQFESAEKWSTEKRWERLNQSSPHTFSLSLFALRNILIIFVNSIFLSRLTFRKTSAQNVNEYQRTKNNNSGCSQHSTNKCSHFYSFHFRKGHSDGVELHRSI